MVWVKFKMENDPRAETDVLRSGRQGLPEVLVVQPARVPKV